MKGPYCVKKVDLGYVRRKIQLGISLLIGGLIITPEIGSIKKQG